MKKPFPLLAVLLIAPLAHADSMKPGLWEFTTQMNGAGMPAMPNLTEAQRKQMEAMGVKLPQAAPGGGMAMSNRLCITPEQAKQGVPPSLDRDGQKCEATDVKSSGKTTTWKMVCTGKHQASGHGTVTYHSDSHISGQTTIRSPEVPAPIDSKFDAKFIAADCKGAK